MPLQMSRICWTNNQVDRAVQVNRFDVDSEAYIMVCDYIQAKLQKAGYFWPDCPELPEPNAVRLAMRFIGEEFLLDSYDLSDTLKITPTMAYTLFFELVDNLFRAGITWGRIVSLFAFGGFIAEQCIRKGISQLVSYIADWVALYTEIHLSQWIIDNGGWVCMIILFFVPLVNK